MRSIFGAQTKEEIKHEKEDPYILLGLTDEPKYLYICAIEEDFGISLE
jgi:hypothetical protein